MATKRPAYIDWTNPATLEFMFYTQGISEIQDTQPIIEASRSVESSTPRSNGNTLDRTEVTATASDEIEYADYRGNVSELWTEKRNGYDPLTKKEKRFTNRVLGSISFNRP